MNGGRARIDQEESFKQLHEMDKEKKKLGTLYKFNDVKPNSKFTEVQ